MRTVIPHLCYCSHQPLTVTHLPRLLLPFKFVCVKKITAYITTHSCVVLKTLNYVALTTPFRDRLSLSLMFIPSYCASAAHPLFSISRLRSSLTHLACLLHTLSSLFSQTLHVPPLIHTPMLSCQLPCFHLCTASVIL